MKVSALTVLMFFVSIVSFNQLGHAQDSHWKMIHSVSYHPESGDRWSILRADYLIDSHSNRVTLDLSICEILYEGESSLIAHMIIPLQGLMFNPSTHEVIYSGEGHFVTCASQREGQLIQTGHCDFHSRVGFASNGNSRQSLFNVFMELK